jgi:hypothetical protein
MWGLGHTISLLAVGVAQGVGGAAMAVRVGFA